MINRKVFRILIIIVLFFLPFLVNAQPPCFVPPCPDEDAGANPVPLGGVELLIGAGALLGAKRILVSRNTQD